MSAEFSNIHRAMSSRCQPLVAARSRNFHIQTGRNAAPSSTPSPLLSLECHDAASLSSRLRSKGYARTSRPLLAPLACRRVKKRMPRLFRGEFETGVYPDEWHWREGIGLPNAAREMCNAWKSDRAIASIVLNEGIGRLAARVMGWESVRIAQDDLVWKPPSAVDGAAGGRIDTVGFHQDSAYISDQFEPYENNSVTLWMALDDADEETGCIEYAVGSHRWRPILHRRREEEEGKTPPDATSNESRSDEISSFHSSDETSYRDGLSGAASLAGLSDPMDTIEAAPAKAGYAILHHQDAWHGSGPNRSRDRHRRALVAHYVRGDVTFREIGGTGAGTRRRGPFGRASYIYGRYKRYDSVRVDESFFPIIYGENRTIWIDDFIQS